MLEVPVIETERLRLTAFAERHFEAYASMLGDPTSTRFVGDGQPLDRMNAWRSMAMLLGHWALRGYGMWAIELKETGEFIGRVGLHQPEGWPDLELGWMLMARHRRHGYATEGARAALDFADDFRWRVSIADIESDGPFSTFPGVTRELMLLSGNGIELDIDDAPPQRLTERFQRVRFDGESRVGCRLLAGPTRDFNAMTRREVARAEVMARPLVGPMVLFAETDVVWLAHVFSGNAEVRADNERTSLDIGDTLRIDFATRDASRVIIEGTGEIVLVKLMPATQNDGEIAATI